MKFHRSTADLFVPDGTPPDVAFERITHLGIGAHQDDLEFMAYHGILACHHSPDNWFGGVTCTDGAGSSRSGPYAEFSDADMQRVRREEQRAAAVVGHYGVMVQLDHPSSVVKSATDTACADDICQILLATRPTTVYTHNLADKHDTHVGVTVAVLDAIRRMPETARPERVLGCEVWRSLDWMLDSEKVPLDVGGHENLAVALNGIFDSQIAGGKRYDLATMGRRRANATYFSSHATDEVEGLWFAMDLTPLALNSALDPLEFVDGFVARFREDIRTRVAVRLGRKS